MLSTSIIVLREVLEAALIVSIVCAATRGVPGRGWWVLGGVLAGVLGAGLVAGFASAIADAAAGVGQELFNAIVLLAAVALLGWHNVWMARHGRELGLQMNRLGRDVHAGARPLYALLLVVALAVLREGAEVVLFLYGVALGGEQGGPMMVGGLLGLVGGAALGLALYMGLLRIPLRYFFTVTSWLILLLAAGLASQAANYLVQADLLPPLGQQVWDSSRLLSPQSLPGQVLHALLGYDAHPSGTQLLFYLITLTTLGLLMKTLGRLPAVAPRAALLGALTLGLALLAPPPAAEAAPSDKVYTPLVEFGETEIELRGGYLKDSDPAVNTTQAYVLDIGYGVRPWWFTELVVEYEKEPRRSGEVEEIEWENIFQLTEQGQYGVDVGLFFEYGLALEAGNPDKIEIGPLLQKEIGRSVSNLNLIAERELGSNASGKTGYEYRAQTEIRNSQPLHWGVQAFGSFGADHQHELGPAIFGSSRLGGHKLKYDAGLLAGLNHNSPDVLFRWQLEYEF